jgi:hypothetical protein
MVLRAQAIKRRGKMKAACFLLFMAMSIYPQQINDKDGYISGYGTSEPKTTVRAAQDSAFARAAADLASKITLTYNSQYTEISIKKGSKIYTTAMEKNNVSSKFQLSGISQAVPRVQKIIIDGKIRFIAYCTVYVSQGEAEKVRLLAENEAIAKTVYHAMNPVANVINDYHSWLICNTGIITIREDINQLDTFIRILFPGCFMYASTYNREPARFLQNPGKLMPVLAKALQFHGIPFTWEFPYMRVGSSAKLGELIKLDSSKVFVTGLEKIHQSFTTLEITSTGFFNKELINALKNKSNKNIIHYSFDDLNKFSEAEEILEFIRTKKNLICRYLIVYCIGSSIRAANEKYLHHLPEQELIVFDQATGAALFLSKLEKGTISPIINERDIPDRYELLIHRILKNTSVLMQITDFFETGNKD